MIKLTINQLHKAQPTPNPHHELVGSLGGLGRGFERLERSLRSQSAAEWGHTLVRLGDGGHEGAHQL